jgi:hypothetical protein
LLIIYTAINLHSLETGVLSFPDATRTVRFLHPHVLSILSIKVSKQLNFPLLSWPAYCQCCCLRHSKIHKQDIYLLITLLTLSGDDQLKIRKHYIAPTDHACVVMQKLEEEDH